MSDDVLKSYNVKRVHGWYLRLAASVGAKQVNGYAPLSSQFLNAYLTNKKKGQVITFTAPPYLQNNLQVASTLQYHRDVFLSQKEARLGSAGTKKIAGILPRLETKKWDGASPLSMNYESLVSIGETTLDIIEIQTRGSDADRDLFTSLRGFQLRSDVTLTGIRTGNSVAVAFTSWSAQGLDTYDFNFKEHLTMPNPDYGSTSPDAIEPKKKSFRVYHTNAERMEKAGLAAPYKVVVGPWTVSSTALLGPATVTVP